MDRDEEDSNEDTGPELADIKQKALHLTAEVVGTDDSNVPVLLLGFKDALNMCKGNREFETTIKRDLWNYDIIRVCHLALKQDFSAIQGQWSTAASLSVLLCQFCVGLELLDDDNYTSTFLPDTVESVLSIATKLLDHYSNASQAEEKQCYQDSFRSVIKGLEMLYTDHEFLCLDVVNSKCFMHILMSEDLEMSLFFMNTVDSMWKYNRMILRQLTSDTLNSILDEIVYKISASEETMVGRAATRLMLTATDHHPTVVSILLSKRYKGLKAHLSKWYNRGFDGDVRCLVGLLEAGSAAEAEQMRLTQSATIIQACFRGFTARKQLQRAERGIILLQHKFRQKRFEQERDLEQKRKIKEKSLLSDRKKMQGFRSSMKKQLQMLETVPAREVNKFMVENQEQAASRIQAAFRGMKTRREMKTLKDVVQRNKAARIIQRQFRRYTKQKKQSTPYPMPPGLTDARRVELQNVIVDHRERFPTKHRSPDELKELHEKAHALLANHLLLRIQTRKSEQKREALLARLKMDTDLLLGAPSLQEATVNACDTFQSRSAPVIARAQLAHNQELKKSNQSWWRKLKDDPPHSVESEPSGLEELNF